MKRYPLLSLAAATVVVLAVASCTGAGAGAGGGGAGGSGTVPEERAVDAMVAALDQLSLDVQQTGTAAELSTSQTGEEPSTRDYVATEVGSDGDRRLKLYIGSDGDLVPTPAWRDANSGYCADRNRYMKSAVDLLNVKVYLLADGYVAFAQYIEIATGRIKEQREGEAAGLQTAIERALNKLTVSPGRAAGPCGEVKDLTLVFQTDLTETIDTGYETTFRHEVAAVVDLTYDDAGNHFEGEADLVWLEHSARSTNPEITYNTCPAPDTGTVSIVYRSGPEGTPDTTVDATVRFKNVGRPDCTFDTPNFPDPVVEPQWAEFDEYWKAYHESEHQGSGRFLIDGWTAVPEENSVVAEKTYDFTDVVTDDSGTLTYDEETTLEITL
jgi:hypothetical protein